jgi:hypothetical protein
MVQAYDRTQTTNLVDISTGITFASNQNKIAFEQKLNRNSSEEIIVGPNITELHEFTRK